MQAGTLRVRVLAYQRGRLVATSQPHKLIVHAVKGLPVVPVSPNAMVLDSSTITSAPAPGAAGTLVYSGGNDAKVGDIIAIGVGPSTPDGFLGQVTAVTTHGADTTVSTVPASLLQAIPSASFDTTSTSVTASTARVTSHALRAAEDKAVQCHGSATATIGSSASVGASIELKGSWSVFHGLQTASLTANAGVSASVTATVAGQGSCTLNPVTVADLPGPKDAFFVGPFPVVITSKITVDVDAKATAAAKLTASIGGGFSARAGLGWTKTGGFYPINTFTPHFTAPAPTITANATVDANLTPTLHVLIDGAEAQLALKAGLAFDADITQNPWWTLNAPVSLTGNLNIPVLKLSSPTLHIYDHTFPLANSGGPFPGSTTTGGGAGAGTGPTNPTGPTGPTGGAPKPTTGLIAAGAYHTCEVLTTGNAACWGANDVGQLGNGTTGPETCPAANVLCNTTPVPVSAITNATQIASGDFQSCALLATGGIDCWGANSDGQLGNGTTTNSSTPVPVSGITNATQITAGEYHSCALLATGSIDCWGDNSYGELGNGTTVNESAPIQVSGVTNATEITNGNYSSCALLTTGSIECWGENTNGQLGNGTTRNSSTPVPVDGITNATQVTAGDGDACALLSTGSVDCWGYAGYGELGDGSFAESSTPMPVSGITNATQIAAGAYQSCAIVATGSVDCWGDNNAGQLGNGTITSSSTFVPVSVITDATEIATGGFYSCALLATGKSDCWGSNNYGQLGNGTTTDSATPEPVTGFP